MKVSESRKFISTVPYSRRNIEYLGCLRAYTLKRHAFGSTLINNSRTRLFRVYTSSVAISILHDDLKHAN